MKRNNYLCNQYIFHYLITMRQLIDPKDTTRAEAFPLWSKSPQPMVTVGKTFDVTRLRKVSRRKGMKFNMLLCWCIGRAASQIDEFYLLVDKGQLYRYDRLAINVFVNHQKGGICTGAIPYSDDIQQFSSDYDRITQQAAIACQNITDDGAQKIGTSAVVGTELDYVVNQYTGVYHDPFLVWSRYHRHWFRTTLAVSMQFHHAQMDGSHVARFLERLQQTINELT